ncbi:phosphoserine phosphatase SerB [Nitratireductor sp. CAU 1489]|uniref:Phosphoserine phosphatase n=1 Tax=Nitratireductor arenosus TaxID=2682096 RepID=A0A844QD55_9HYPH|nr:phosphoserine phosphatase SerB [Nitratireductor arenosus]MVA97192.1 phosphoserine phosphatase SerB [Nitratireductor arenosus]
MALVATIISNPVARALSEDAATMAISALGASRIDWLAPAIAADIVVPEGVDHAEAAARLRAALEDYPLDIVVQDEAGRRKKILIADMDSTMIGQECIDELADEVGLRGQVETITARAMDGEIAFEPALRERVALLKGLPVEVVARVIAERITLAPGGRELVATMRKNGAFTALVSGGFTLFTGPVAAMLGFHDNQANRLVEENGVLTGRVDEPILGRSAKAEALHAIAARLGLGVQDAIAVGDGANDLDMLQLAGTGVALHAKPSVAAQARIRVDYGDLTALLYLQGYRQSEFDRP